MRLIDADILLGMTVKRNRIWDGITDSNGKGLAEIINSVPTVEDRKSGKWIIYSGDQYTEFPYKRYKCSECGKLVMTMDINAYNFCDNCGADMKGKDLSTYYN